MSLNLMGFYCNDIKILVSAVLYLNIFNLIAVLAEKCVFC